ncbi:caspase family protein [Alisedimentitalea sp. MJ-SS2]|uniref:caspase, EACC1-associated type n=1 Tax=Aliisedimentitalea sp. MJ-SS2 TaxID=3049795 RepID=UPI00291178E2|nr:caspase family protein [Alisedimentitalea sp. MJ-SS2]MDU8929915.1 caspase family protein [Alisedimentitalea sp. MJ-SS2]
MANKALLIGVQRYNSQLIHPLTAPASDIEKFAEVLKKSGYEVEVCMDPGLQEAQVRIHDLYDNAAEGDSLIFYYAGHGMREDKELYLSVRSTDPARLSATSVRGELVRDMISDSASKRKIIILDCCHAGGLTENLIGRAVEYNANKELVEGRFQPQGQGTYVMAASLADQSAFERKDPETGESHSIYTHHLINGIVTGEAAPDSETITTDQLHSYVYHKVKAEGVDSEPVYSSFGKGRSLEICLNPVPPVDAQIVADLHDRNDIIRRGAIDLIAQKMDRDLTSPQSNRLAQLLRDRLGDTSDHERHLDLINKIKAILKRFDRAQKPEKPPSGSGDSPDPGPARTPPQPDGQIKKDGDKENEETDEPRDSILLKIWQLIKRNRVFLLAPPLVLYAISVAFFVSDQNQKGQIEWGAFAALDAMLFRDLHPTHTKKPDKPTPEDNNIGQYTEKEFLNLLCDLRGSKRDDIRKRLGADSAHFYALLDRLGEGKALGCDKYRTTDDYRIDLGILIAMQTILTRHRDQLGTLDLDRTDVAKVSKLTKHSDRTMARTANSVLRLMGTKTDTTRVTTPTSASEAYKAYYLTPLEPAKFDAIYSGIKTKRDLNSIILDHTFAPNAEQTLNAGDEKTVEGIRRFQVDRNGWSDVGTHFFVSPSGHIIPGRSLDQRPTVLRGAQGDAKSGPVAIQLLLNGDKEKPNSKQQKALIAVLEVFQNHHDVDIKRDVFLEKGFPRSHGNKSGPGKLVTGREIASWYEKYATSATKPDRSIARPTRCDATVFRMPGSEKPLSSIGLLSFRKDVIEQGDPLRIFFEPRAGYSAAHHSCLSIHLCEQVSLNTCKTVEIVYARTTDKGLELDFKPTKDELKPGSYRTVFDIIQVDDPSALTPNADGLVRPEKYQRIGGALSFQVFAEKPLSGFVMLGPNDLNQVSKRTFDVLNPKDEDYISESLPVGALLKARTDVNLRTNTQHTDSGNNPALTVIPQGACVTMTARPEAHRSNLWAAATLTACP